MGHKDNIKKCIENNSDKYTDEEPDNKIEHFDQNSVRDTCHYACSSFSYVNVIIIIVVLLLIYHFIANMGK